MLSIINFQSITLICLFILFGCGGSSSNSAGNSVTTAQLSGVIGLGNISAGVQSANRFGSSPENQIVVLAIDTLGNSFATTTDSSGYFKFTKSIGIRKNTSYALTFIDMSSLEIIATLTSGSGQAGMLTIRGDTELTEIVIDPGIKLASIFGDVRVDGEITNLLLLAADSLDKNGDGLISQAEIMTTLVNTTQVGNIDSITSVSAFTFLGQKDTWTIAVDLEDDAFEGNVCEWINQDNPPPATPAECKDENIINDPEISFFTDSGEITMLATDRVEGPEGSLINAIKVLEMTYLNKPYADPDSNYTDVIDQSLLWDIGYASGSQADINNSARLFGSGAGITDEYWTPYLDMSLGSPPTKIYSQQMGLLGWSEYSFADAMQGQLVKGSKRKDSDSGTLLIKWGESALPLNLPINREFEFTETETNEIINPVTGQESIEVESVTSLVTVTLALNGDGSPALLQEGNGSSNILPVFQIRFTDPENGESECSYIVARFGVEGDDVDGNCNNTSDWQASFIDVRFGRVIVENDQITIEDRTPDAIIANDSGSKGLPIDEDGNLTIAARQWLEYIYQNATGLDYQFESLQFTAKNEWGDSTEFWAWVKSPDSGSALIPQPAPNPNDPTQTILKMGESPGEITINNIHYMSSASSVEFYLDLRTTDAVEPGEFSVLDNPVAINPVTDTATPTDNERVIDISASFPALPPAGDSKWRHVWNSLEDPDATGPQTYRSARVNLWIIMDADANLATTDDSYEFPVDGYRVIDPLPLN